jgi:hypothetical protein
MTTKADFRSIVNGAINRGTFPAATIDAAVKRAIGFLENNNNLFYMKQHLQFSKDPTQPSPLSDPWITLHLLKRLLPGGVQLPELDPVGSQTTNITYIRNIRQIEPGELTNYAPVGRPAAMIQSMDPNGLDVRFTFDVLAFDTAITIDVWGYFKTDFDSIMDTQGHWLFDNGADWLLARTMYLLAPIIRQPESLPMWKDQAMEGWTALNFANAELEQSERDERMDYSGEVIPQRWMPES